MEEAFDFWGSEWGLITIILLIIHFFVIIITMVDLFDSSPRKLVDSKWKFWFLILTGIIGVLVISIPNWLAVLYQRYQDLL